jgi:hypothetical protein
MALPRRLGYRLDRIEGTPRKLQPKSRKGMIWSWSDHSCSGASSDAVLRYREPPGQCHPAPLVGFEAVLTASLNEACHQKAARSSRDDESLALGL